MINDEEKCLPLDRTTKTNACFASVEKIAAYINSNKRRSFCLFNTNHTRCYCLPTAFEWATSFVCLSLLVHWEKKHFYSLLIIHYESAHYPHMKSSKSQPYEEIEGRRKTIPYSIWAGTIFCIIALMKFTIVDERKREKKGVKDKQWHTLL